jgi:hypothetical protein
MNNNENIETELLEEMWNDADFKQSKNAPQSGEILKKNSIRKLNQDNFYIANCKVCNSELKLSCNYSGEYPLCKVHRDPNDRPIKPLKSFKNKT